MKIKDIRLGNKFWFSVNRVTPVEGTVIAMYKNGQTSHVTLATANGTFKVSPHATRGNGWGFESHFPFAETKDRWAELAQAEMLRLHKLGDKEDWGSEFPLLRCDVS